MGIHKKKTFEVSCKGLSSFSFSPTKAYTGKSTAVQSALPRSDIWRRTQRYLFLRDRQHCSFRLSHSWKSSVVPCFFQYLCTVLCTDFRISHMLQFPGSVWELCMHSPTIGFLSWGEQYFCACQRFSSPVDNLCNQDKSPNFLWEVMKARVGPLCFLLLC